MYRYQFIADIVNTMPLIVPADKAVMGLLSATSALDDSFTGKHLPAILSKQFASIILNLFAK